MKQIFLISGKALSGKDSTANFLFKKLIGKSLIIHNSDMLKFIATQYLGWNGNKDENGRALLQVLGTEKTKLALNKPLFWTERVCDIIEILKNDYDYFFVPDTRFKSEIYYPQSRFTEHIYSLRVERLNFDNGLTKKQKEHISETDLDDFKFDYTIKSQSGLDNLEKEIDYFIKIYTIWQLQKNTL
jgi:hypothetical protein